MEEGELMKRLRERLFPAGAPGCAMPDLRVVVVPVVLLAAAAAGFLIGRFL